MSKTNMPCKDCGKERFIDASKISYEKYMVRSPRCRPCASVQPELVEKISKGWFTKERLNGNSFAKGHRPWNFGWKGVHLSLATEFKKGQRPWNEGKTHMQDEKHPNWAGESVGYNALHSWIHRKLGQPGTCMECGKSGLTGRKIHWANISRTYRRDLSDWVRLCSKCHKNYDMGNLKLACVA